MARPPKLGVRGLTKIDRGKLKGRYRIDLRWRHPQTRNDHRYTEVLPAGTTGGAAKLRAQAVNAAALAGTLPTDKSAKAAPLTLGAALDQYLEWCAINGKGNPKYKKRHVKTLNATLGESTKLEKLSELSIEKHKQARRKEGKQNGTINRELQTFKHFLNRAVDWGWLAKRPKVVLLQEAPPRVRWLTDKERARLAKELSAPRRVHFRRVVEAALLSGQRLGNVIGLKKSEVDLKHRTFKVTLRKGGVVRRNDVPISDALAAVLKGAMAASKCEHVFVNGRASPYTSSGVTAFFRKLVDAAGIKDLHFHDLRHDFATQVRRSGKGLDVVQALLGHATPAMTQRYAHIGADELHQAVEAATPLG